MPPRRQRAKRPTKAKGASLAMHPRPPKWGATQREAKAFAETRALKNRIHELEQELVATGTADTSWHPTGNEIHALYQVISLPVVAATEAGIAAHLGELASWHRRLERWNRQRPQATVEAIRAAGAQVAVGGVVHVPVGVGGGLEYYVGQITKVIGKGRMTVLVRLSRGGSYSVELKVADEGKTWKWP